MLNSNLHVSVDGVFPSDVLDVGLLSLVVPGAVELVYLDGHVPQLEEIEGLPDLTKTAST